MALAFAAFHIVFLVIAAALLIGAAVSDARDYRIPNFISALLLLLFPLFVATAPRAIDWRQNLMVFGLVGGAGLIMFLAHLAGAGDIKLLASISLWAGPHLIALLLVYTAIAGGCVAMIVALLAYFRNRRTVEKPSLATIPIPYGIAIAIGGLTALSRIALPILSPG